MKKVNSIASLLILLLLISGACAKKQYAVKTANGYLVEMNNRFDNHADPGMTALVRKYKSRLDSTVNEVIGESAQVLTKTGTQSVLANFTTDAMLEYAKGMWGQVDFAVVNNGGLRSTLNQGPVTVENLYEIYAFENRLVLLEMPGKAVRQLFEGFVRRKMEGFSKGVQLVLKDKTIESLTIGGKPVDDNATYRVVTVDYLAEGNDGMEAFTQAAHYTDSNIILREAMIEYVKKLTAENKKIYATSDDRIKVEK